MKGLDCDVQMPGPDTQLDGSSAIGISVDVQCSRRSEVAADIPVMPKARFRQRSIVDPVEPAV